MRNGQLGVAPTGSPLSKNELLKQQHLVQEQEATIAQLKKDFGATVAQLAAARLNEQASQIQKRGAHSLKRANLRREWSTIPKAAARSNKAALHNQPSRFSAWRLFCFTVTVL